MVDCAVRPIAQAAGFAHSLHKTLLAFFSPKPPYITISTFCHKHQRLLWCFVTYYWGNYITFFRYLQENEVGKHDEQGHKHELFCDLTFLHPKTNNCKISRIYLGYILIFYLFWTAVYQQNVDFVLWNQPQMRQLSCMFCTWCDEVNASGFDAGMPQHVSKFCNILAGSIEYRRKQMPQVMRKYLARFHARKFT